MSTAFICRRYLLNDEELSATFDLLDMDKDGSLSRVEIGALLRTVNIEPTRRELDFIFAEIDSKKSGKIDKQAFVDYLRTPPIHKFTLHELEEHFQRVDSDRDGAINEEQLYRLLLDGANIDDHWLVRQIFETADPNASGRITFDQFVDVLRH